jgi:hypothetical protein
MIVYMIRFKKSLRCYSPEGHNFYNRHANGLRQKIKAALLPFKTMEDYKIAPQTFFEPRELALCLFVVFSI